MLLTKIFKNKNTSLGIDIGEKEIAVVELVFDKAQIVLNKFGLILIKDGEKDEKKIASALKEVIAGNNIRSKTAYVAIPSIQIIKKEFSFSAELIAADIETQLNINQEKYFPGINERLAFDFKTASRFNSDNNFKIVTVFATRKKELEKRSDILKQAGITALCIEPDSYALLRNVTMFNEIMPSENEVSMLFEMGNHPGRAVFFNHFEIISDQHFSEINFAAVNDISRALKQMQHDFQLRHPGFILKKIYMLGNKDNNDVLKEKIEQETRQIVSIENPLQKINVIDNKFENNFGKFLMALGLALRGRNVSN